MARKLAVAAVALAVVTVCGSGCSASDGRGGSWAGCANVAPPSEVQVRRTLPDHDFGMQPLSVIQRDPALVHRWFRDACAIMAHPSSLPNGPINCPNAFGLTYHGVFYAGRKKVAVVRYWASGCEGFTLSIGTDQATTWFFGRGALAQTAFNDDLAAVLGIRRSAIYAR